MKQFLFVICVFFSFVAEAQLTYQNLIVDYDSAKEYKNLRIVPIRRKGPPGPGDRNLVSFSEAIKKGYVTLSERGSASTENVHYLRVRNNSSKSVFIASGELVLGGRQDRMIKKDTIIGPSAKDQYIDVMCVEEGRWSEREKKFSYFNYANPRLRRTLDQSGNQVVIWREILRQLDSNKIKAATLAYSATRLNKKLMPQFEDYFKFFNTALKKSDTTVVGMVCMSGNKIIGCDIFESTSLFYSEVEPLLYGYIEEAFAFGAPVRIKPEDLQKYMDQLLKDETTQAEFLKKNGKIYRFQGRVIHITGFGQ
jgi:hypothetical protein